MKLYSEGGRKCGDRNAKRGNIPRQGVAWSLDILEAMPKASELRSRGLSAATPPDKDAKQKSLIPKGSQQQMHGSVIPSGSIPLLLRKPGVSLRSTPV